MAIIRRRRIGKNQNKRLGRRIAGPRCYAFHAASLIALAVWPQSVLLAEVDFSLDLDVGVIHSDNIVLAADGEEQDETVYSIVPEFRLTSDNSRLQADIRYRPQAYYYQEIENADSIFHTVDASVFATLIREHLFLELSASNFEAIVTPQASVPSGNLPISGNRTETRVLGATPSFQQRIGSADLIIQGSYFDVEYEESAFQSSEEIQGYFQLGNVQRQQGLAWQTSYIHRRTEYDLSPPWEFQRAALNLGAWINESTRLFAVGGAETAFDNLFESNLDSDFWEAGFQYTPNARFNLELAFGDRSYGSSARGNMSYELKRGDIQFNYSEGPANRGEILNDRRPLETFDGLDGALDRPGAADRFVRKRGDLRVTIELAKSDINFRLYSERRENRTSPDGTGLGDEHMSGGGLRWSWRMGSRTTLGAGADIVERTYGSEDDELFRTLTDLEYQVSRRFSIRVEVARFDQSGSELEDYDYTENQYRLFLRTSF